MTEFSARDPTSGLHIQPGDFYLQNRTVVDGLDDYRSVIAATPTLRCGQPVSTGTNPLASDCLYILKPAGGSETCTPECICDVNASGGLTAADALLCLKNAVGEDMTLGCGPACILASTDLPGATP